MCSLHPESYLNDDFRNYVKNHPINSLVSATCPFCKVVYQKPRQYFVSRNFSRKVTYCSSECDLKSRLTKIAVTCSECNCQFKKHPSQRRPNRNDFCSKSCAARFNNRNKTSGYRTSKLEQYLVSQIQTKYPHITVVNSDRKTIGYELDIFLPELRLAIELNGIVHYEPIYGLDKFERIQHNDKQKVTLCHQQGIELMIVNVSSESHFSQKTKEKYWKLIDSILSQVIHRAGWREHSDSN